MPRYFFHITDGHTSPDEEGTVLPDIYTAQEQAIRMAGELLREMHARFWNGTEWTLEVADEEGKILFVLRFSAEESPAASHALPDRAAP